MSSSGLIFAVIVGAWAAYLVPMWLRRQDELNEARPTERFSTALRLLTRGRRGAPAPASDADADADAVPEPASPNADLRAFAEPVTNASVPPPAPPRAATPDPRAAARATVLARRRRTTMVLFLAFTLGGILALSSGPGLLWLPGVPAVLLLAYVIHVRQQERRRYAVELDRRRAEEAARRLRQRTQASAAARPDPPKPPAPAPAQKPERPARAVVEQTDHAEWVDQQRGSAGTPPEDEPDTWDPAPVPLPTYVNAPVAPRTTRGVDLDAPGTWSAARSTTAGTTPPQPRGQDQPATPRRTPLFDQYADDEHPPRRRRASGE